MINVTKEVLPAAVSEVMPENQARAVVYNFLSSLFAKEVNEDLVSQLTSTQGQSFLRSLALEPTLAPSINVISTELIKLNSKESLLELAADFCGLFLVDGKTSVSPYAGQYINKNVTNTDTIKNKKSSDKTLIFGELHQLMMTFLTRSNIQIHSEFPEPADHIAVMLAYLAQLSLSASTKNQLDFIEMYLMTWLNDFTQQVIKHDPGCFYAALAELTFEWITLDIDN
ncbi:MAG: TorA-specific chaperone [Colwellia sp.]|jgi:TorA-specific chaperone